MGNNSVNQDNEECSRPLSRAARQLFRRDASQILLHYFGDAWRTEVGSQTYHADLIAATDRVTTDKRGMKRQRIQLVDNPEDRLSDDEWFQLLAYAIDSSNAIKKDNSHDHHFCPLHPKYDMYLADDQNSFLIQRRYLFGKKRFGGLSLPMLGRAARSILWLEERDTYHTHQHPKTTSTAINKNYKGNTVHLFQCGYCEKTFVSRYYLDRHMDLHHRKNSNNLSHDNSNDESVDKNTLICPSDHICDPLGGTSACTEMMSQISPYWGQGTMLGKDYIDSTRESFFSSSIHSLLEYFHLDGSTEPIERGLSNTEEDQSTEKKMSKYSERVREGDLSNIVGEMRHRSFMRTKLLLQSFLVKTQQNRQQEVIDDTDENLHHQNEIQYDTHHHLSSATCDVEEMERLFGLCQDMMLTCFGNEDPFSGDNQEGIGHHVNLVHDLIEQICQPLHCHHRLHRMAGHNTRHMVMWKNEWEEHHSYSLGLLGWLVVIGFAIFYLCAFMLGVGSNWESNLLPSYRLGGRRQKKKSS